MLLLYICAAVLVSLISGQMIARWIKRNIYLWSYQQPYWQYPPGAAALVLVSTVIAPPYYYPAIIIALFYLYSLNGITTSIYLPSGSPARLIYLQYAVHSIQGLIQQMLDLRIYRLKIHYNSTTPGHIIQIGKDKLLYKDIIFVIGDFRGFIHRLLGAIYYILSE